MVISVKAQPLGDISNPKEGKKMFGRQFVCLLGDGSREVFRLFSEDRSKLEGNEDRALKVKLFCDAGALA